MMRASRGEREHRARDDARYFGVILRQREHWRLYEWLRSQGSLPRHRDGLVWSDHRRGILGRGRFTSLVQGESLNRQRL